MPPPERGVKPAYQQVVERLRLLDRLAEFDPLIIGTPPLGIDIPGSDIDVACSAPDLERFSDAARRLFGPRKIVSSYH